MKKFIILITSLLLLGCQNYSELNKLAIVTAIGIDKEDGKYKVTVLIANSPKVSTTSKEGEAKTTVYSSNGKTIGEAIKGIDLKSPKELYFSHVNSVIISKKIGEDGFFKVADYLMRNPEARNRFYLLEVDGDDASDVLKIISPLESYPSQSIATLIESSQNSRSVGFASSYSNFVGRVLEKGYDPVMSTIKINGKVKKGSKQENIETAEPSTYLSLGPFTIYKNDKRIGMANQKETELIQMLYNETKELTYDIKYKGENVSIFSNMTKTKMNLLDKNHVKIDIDVKGDIYEINNNINLNNYKKIDDINKVFEKSLKKDLDKLINKIKYNWKSDILGFGNMIYKKYPQYYKKLKNGYIKNIEVDVNVNTQILSAGSLTKTFKEDR